MTTPAPSLETRKDFGAGALSATFDDALQFAFERHRFHFRKGSRVPYLSHLMSVCALVLEHGGSEEQAIAALLHDAVEDASPGQGLEVLQAIGEQFGEAAQAIVQACSDTLNDDEHGKPCWPERKLAYVHGLASKSDDALLVTAADKIHNALSIARDLRAFGLDFWSTFNASAPDLLWYYTAVEAAIAKGLGEHTVVGALHQAVDELLAAAKTDRADVRSKPSTCDCPKHRNREDPAAA
jgi:(p)ppGpp synthase/HD superfamily hydrolase